MACGLGGGSTSPSARGPSRPRRWKLLCILGSRCACHALSNKSRSAVSPSTPITYVRVLICWSKRVSVPSAAGHRSCIACNMSWMGTLYIAGSQVMESRSTSSYTSSARSTSCAHETFQRAQGRSPRRELRVELCRAASERDGCLRRRKRPQTAAKTALRISLAWSLASGTCPPTDM